LTFEVGGSSLVVATLDIAQTEEAESLLRNIILGSSRKLSNDKPEMGG
jgi:hypothetical protein